MPAAVGDVIAARTKGTRNASVGDRRVEHNLREETSSFCGTMLPSVWPVASLTAAKPLRWGGFRRGSANSCGRRVTLTVNAAPARSSRNSPRRITATLPRKPATLRATGGSSRVATIRVGGHLHRQSPSFTSAGAVAQAQRKTSARRHPAAVSRSSSSCRGSSTGQWYHALCGDVTAQAGHCVVCQAWPQPGQTPPVQKVCHEVPQPGKQDQRSSATGWYSQCGQ